MTKIPVSTPKVSKVKPAKPVKMGLPRTLIKPPATGLSAIMTLGFTLRVLLGRLVKMVKTGLLHTSAITATGLSAIRTPIFHLVEYKDHRGNPAKMVIEDPKVTLVHPVSKALTARMVRMGKLLPLPRLLRQRLICPVTV